ncbi:MAG: hypothetical protein KatS3mg096_246 [Candidatus Parcubacteria bacterium]|nr:MAG: hypothetical protein KatS3mg096_246 [Candidatus Parcubacteria bacterium]
MKRTQKNKKTTHKNKFKNLILTPRKELFTNMSAHHIVKGLTPYLYKFSDNINNPKGKLFVACRVLDNVKNTKPHVSYHSHSVDQMYMWIGNKKNLKGLKVEVFLGDENYILNSPVAVYIPAGIKHSHRYIKGSGFFIGILVTNGKSYNEVTKNV